MFLVTLFLQITAISFLIALAFAWDKQMEIQCYLLLVYICLEMPYIAYPLANSLLSKITDPQNASFIQGLSYAAMHCATVITRIVVSFVFSKTSLIFNCFVLVFFWLIASIWYAVIYKRLLYQILSLENLVSTS